MPTLTHKVQVLLDDEQYQALVELARARGLSLSTLLRQAVVDGLLGEVRRDRKKKAAQAIAALRLPVSGWEQMEGEIERGRQDDPL